MVISHSKQFIFVHVPKTGGTSITHALRNYSSYGISGYNWLDGLPFHLTYEEIDRDIRDRNYFSFGFMRNPWDLMVSLYEYARINIIDLTKPAILSFAGFVDVFKYYIKYNDVDTKFLIANFGRNSIATNTRYFPQLHYLNGVEFIGKYERLQEDFDLVCSRLQIPKNILPKMNHSNRQIDYKHYYNDRTINQVAELFKDDIEYAGYEFCSS